MEIIIRVLLRELNWNVHEKDFIKQCYINVYFFPTGKRYLQYVLLIKGTHFLCGNFEKYT